MLLHGADAGRSPCHPQCGSILFAAPCGRCGSAWRLLLKWPGGPCDPTMPAPHTSSSNPVASCLIQELCISRDILVCGSGNEAACFQPGMEIPAEQHKQQSRVQKRAPILPRHAALSSMMLRARSQQHGPTLRQLLQLPGLHLIQSLCRSELVIHPKLMIRV